MKVGVRKPSIKRSIKARTTGRIKREAKKAVNPFYGKKGIGWVKDPEKALYNKVYHKTTVGVTDAARVVLSNDSKNSNNRDSIDNNGYYNNSEAKPSPSPKIGMFLIVAGIVLIIMSLLLLVAAVIPGLLGIALGVFSIVKGSSIRKKTKSLDVE